MKWVSYPSSLNTHSSLFDCIFDSGIFVYILSSVFFFFLVFLATI